jgi:hypothetical protein
MWINTDDINTTIEGQAGFLVEISPQGQADRYDLRDEPARTNQSHEAKLTGWCGETNNVNVNAKGVWKPVRRSPNGRRTLIERVTDPAELAEFLETVGYPELIP